MKNAFDIKKYVLSMLSLLYNNNCAYCNAELESLINTGLCQHCWDNIRKIKEPVCLQCGMPFHNPKNCSVVRHKCSHCLSCNSPYSFCRSSALYTDEFRKAIHSFKYEGNFSAGKKLGQLLSETYQAHTVFHCCDLISFVPLHWKRKRERQFNQSELLAKMLSKNSNKPLQSVLKRDRNTTPQTLLSSEMRKKNLKDAFSVTNATYIDGKTILLVDDVYTTGSTVKECSRTLLKGGARRVLIITAGRAE